MEDQSALENSKSEPLRITIESIQETPQQKQIREVADTARDEALALMSSASSLESYMRWHHAASYFRADHIAWFWDYGGCTTEELVAEQATEVFVQNATRNAKAAEDLRRSVEQLEKREGFTRVALKRVRDASGYYSYRALASFTSDDKVEDLTDSIASHRERSGEDIIFYEPESACVSHACDDLYKVHRNSPFYIESRTLKEATEALQNADNGLLEYLLEKTESGNVTQEANNYLVVALKGGFWNEQNRVRVSDFWNKYKNATEE